jgi:PEGA domain
MQSAANASTSSPAPEFADGLGARLKMADAAEPLEVLRLRSEFLSSPSFEFMLRERVSRLANFRHAYYSRVRRVDRLDNGSTLGIVSETPHGPRLSRILEVASACQIDLDVNAALCLVRQLVPAIAMLHQNARDVSHGALAPERIIVTSNARVVIVEYVLGAAIEQLAYSRERLWRDLRIAAPSGAGVARLNHRADVMQLGMVALALVLGRPLGDDDLKSLPSLLGSATESSALGGREPISEALRRWLSRSLQLDSRNSFESALEAQLALDDVLSGESGYIAAPIALESFLARYEECSPQVPLQAAPVAPAAPAAPATPVARVAPVVSVAPVTPDAPAALVAPPVPSVRAAEVDSIETEALREEALREAFRPQATEPEPRTSVAPFWRRAAIGLAVVAVIETAIIVWSFGGTAISSSSGTVIIESKPSGAQVTIDGQDKGMTPLSTKVSAGAHVIEIASGGEPRVIPMSIESGQTFAQYLELTNGTSLGRLAVASTPTGAAILLDGQPHGTAPTEIPDIAAGEHELTLELNGMRVRQPVSVSAGTTTTVAVPMTGPTATAIPPPPPTTGSLVVQVPFEMQVFEGDQLLGVTSSRLALQPGPHELRVVSETLAFNTSLHAEIVAGKSTRLAVPLPKGVIHLNAAPWAEVWIDGQKVGETPIGNLPITIGPHEIVFKHPELGEQHHAATVTASVPVRLSVDLRKPQ